MQIKRSIEFIESCTESRVIALCMYPMDWNNPEQGIFSKYSKIDPRKFLKIKNDLERRFEVPVFLLGEEPDMEMLYEHVVDFFRINKEKNSN